MTKTRFLLAFLTLAACADTVGNPDVATEFRDTPLRALSGVQIGMPSQRLKLARPAATNDMATGMRENIPGHSVSYKFRLTDQGGTIDIGPNEPLLAIFMTRPLPSLDEASTAWREQVRSVTQSRRAPDLCESVAGGGMQARWLSDKMMLVIGAFPGDQVNPLVTARMVLAFGHTAAIKQPEGATPVACPTS